MSSESRDYLRAYARGERMGPPRQPDESVEAYAQRIGADPDAPTEPQDVAPADAPTEEPGEEQPGDQEEQGKRSASPHLKWLDGANSATQGWRDRIAAAPTPGGAGALLLILLLMLFLIIPVNAGYTRAQLLWLTLLGKTTLPSSTPPAGGSSSSSSSTSGSSSSGSSSSSSSSSPLAGLGRIPGVAGVAAAEQAVGINAQGLGNVLLPGFGTFLGAAGNVLSPAPPVQMPPTWP